MIVVETIGRRSDFCVYSEVRMGLYNTSSTIYRIITNMSEGNKKMGLALVCADGRLHQGCVKYNEQIAEALGVDVVDEVAVPGPDGLFKKGREGERKATLGWLKLLIAAHHPTAIALVGHYQCAGNPESDAEHDVDAATAAAALKKELGFVGEIVAISTVWHSDSEWSLKKVAVRESVESKKIRQKILSPIQFPVAVFHYFRSHK